MCIVSNSVRTTLDSILSDASQGVTISLGTGGMSFQANDNDQFIFNEGETNVDLRMNKLGENKHLWNVLLF